MAEFPELGKNCSLEACKKLDFTPFFCDKCNKYFCDGHRFDHSCQFKKLDSGQLATSSYNGSKQLRPYLCSMDGCFTSEIIRIDCQHCGLNFCLKHRYREEHQCHAQDAKNGQINKDVQEGLKKKILMITASNKRDIDKASSPPSPQKEKPMDENMQRRADRIAVMRLKSNIRNCDRWTIGRCLDQIAKQCSITNNNATFGNKVLRLYCETNHSNPLPMGDNVEKYLKDFSNVFLKRDE